MLTVTSLILKQELNVCEVNAGRFPFCTKVVEQQTNTSKPNLLYVDTINSGNKYCEYFLFVSQVMNDDPAFAQHLSPAANYVFVICITVSATVCLR